jgi:hypothetical protein
MQSLIRLDDNRPEKGVNLKFTPPWQRRDGGTLSLDDPMLVMGTARFSRNWGPPIETIVHRSGVTPPDLAELNAAIPRSAWPSFGGQQVEPWRKYYLVFLLRITDATLFHYYSAAISARLMIRSIEERVELMQMLRGASVLPLVKLADRPFTTQFGERRAPELGVIGWRQLGAGAPQIADQSAGGLQAVEPLQLAELLQDEVPY